MTYGTNPLAQSESLARLEALAYGLEYSEWERWLWQFALDYGKVFVREGTGFKKVRNVIRYSDGHKYYEMIRCPSPEG